MASSSPSESESDETKEQPLDEDDIAFPNTDDIGPCVEAIDEAEEEIQNLEKKIKDLLPLRINNTALAPPSKWDRDFDMQILIGADKALKVATCTRIINPNSKDTRYLINFHGPRHYVVGLGDTVPPTDIEEGMRVGVDRRTYKIMVPLPPKMNHNVRMMIVEERPNVTYDDIGGCREQIKTLREVVELPMLYPEKFARLGIEPPKGVLCHGLPGTGKTLVARALANRTSACFIRVISSVLIREGPPMVRQLFQMARCKKPCILFFDEVDAIGCSRLKGHGKEIVRTAKRSRFEGHGEDRDIEVQRAILLELLNQLDGIDPRRNIMVLMETNRTDLLDPAFVRVDRHVAFGLPDAPSRTEIFKIHTRTMNCERDIRFEVLARLCPNSTGADIRNVCTEAGMFAIRERRERVSEGDFLAAIHKVIKGYNRFSTTQKYML
ncbi:26S proteasome regulatory subunit 7-like [Ipomoea triloba]|uniref:26S proteasome regulatory subunit 7-like n=1 Tax=Ipomoea triloba TaxID=35885 RepID=UPI00125E8287|nr:26S proteasome regulatory subunit 7-like [Ipomoea triloba]XP_031118509.1 26S proteasome regulatory subunit 7-like [Ipomoea triloba]